VATTTKKTFSNLSGKRHFSAYKKPWLVKIIIKLAELIAFPSWNHAQFYHHDDDGQTDCESDSMELWINGCGVEKGLSLSCRIYINVASVGEQWSVYGFHTMKAHSALLVGQRERI
jgi:hypothetical protein